MHSGYVLIPCRRRTSRCLVPNHVFNHASLPPQGPSMASSPTFEASPGCLVRLPECGCLGACNLACTALEAFPMARTWNLADILTPLTPAVAAFSSRSQVRFVGPDALLIAANSSCQFLSCERIRLSYQSQDEEDLWKEEEHQGERVARRKRRLQTKGSSTNLCVLQQILVNRLGPRQ